MADYAYGGSEEENAELRKLETELVCPGLFASFSLHLLTYSFSQHIGGGSRQL